MATSPKAPPLKLTRDQLASFLKDFEQIKQFENLFAIVQSIAPIVGTDFEYAADTANAKANEALALISALAQEAAINSWNADSKAVQALDAFERMAKIVNLLSLAPAVQNNNSVKTDYVDLNQNAPLPADLPGRFYWNLDDGTMDVDQYGSNVLQVGQELQYYAQNIFGSQVAIGTPVMFAGTVGASSKLRFTKAIADGSVIADFMMGVASQNIANNDFGYITHFGVVRGFNTTGTPYGETWSDGDLLYFSPAAPGTWTNVQPAAPNIDVPVAVVLNAGPGGSGSIFVRMSVAESLSKLQDVFINGTGVPQDFDILLYNAALSRWENKPASTVQVLTWMDM